MASNTRRWHRSLARVQRRRGPQAIGEFPSQRRGFADDHGLNSHRHHPGHRGEADGARAQHRHPVRGRHLAPAQGAAHDSKRLHQGLFVGIHRRREGEELVGPDSHELGEPSRALQTDELEPGTVIGSPAEAKGAPTAARERARHHRLARTPPTGVDLPANARHFAGDLVTEHGAGRRQLAGEMQVAAADPAAGDPQQRLAGSGHRVRDVGELKPGTVLGEDDGPHAVSPR